MAFDQNAQSVKATVEEAREVSKSVGAAIWWSPDGNYREEAYALIYHGGVSCESVG